MSLLTAHRILIALAIGLFALYALWEYGAYASNGNLWAAVRAAASAAVAVALGVYFRAIGRFARPQGNRTS